MSRIALTDIYKAVAKEMAYTGNQSKTEIANIIKNYIKTLRSEGYSVKTSSSTKVNSCARTVNYLASTFYK
jgi:hypothetical protein